MSAIESDVAELVRARRGLTLVDGLLIGALIGAAGASLVIVGQLVASRRLARRYGKVQPPPLPGPPPEGSPL